MNMKTRIAKAKAKAKTQVRREVITPFVPIELEVALQNDGAEAIAKVLSEALQAVFMQLATAQQQNTQTVLAAIEAQNKAVTEALKGLVDRPVKVNGSPVKVNMPPRPASFTVEFDDGRTATLTPDYGKMN